MTSSVAKRRRSAYAAAAAAKQRRQKIFVIVGFVLFVAVMAYEVPKILNRGGGGTPAPAAAAAPVAAAAKPKALPKSLRTGRGVDPFAARSLSSTDPQVGAPLPGRDPFLSHATPAPAATTTAPLPETIVIGTPTASGATVHGWIVILASIPTRQGQASAESFARSARRNGIGAVSVLNSSNRRPLRGGYWVVYTGPVKTVSAAENLASNVHVSGYRAAYVRELIEYR